MNAPAGTVARATALEAALALQPGIAARSDEMEAARRLPADLAAEMARAGLFRIAMPRSLGGDELPPAEILRVIEAVAQADASAGWCLMIGSTTAVSLAYLPHDVAAAIAADRDCITGGVFAPSGKAVAEGDHYRVSGRWSWASGSANCSWLFGGCTVWEGGQMRTLPGGRPDTRMMVMPAGKVELIDSWHAAGLKGTGSGDMAVTDLAVPLDYSLSLVSDPPVETGALYLFPVFGLLALGIAGAASGNARAALDALKAGLGSRKPAGSSRSAAERATVQQDYAKAEALLTSARALLFETLDRAWDSANRDGEVGLETRARLRLAATHMVRTAADVTRIAYDLGGGGALYLESPLQRRFRDGHAMTQHMMVQPATYEMAGRVLLGLPTDASML
ncbi:MAG: acyl-CoA dehydrogenase family protein [Sandaracinobacteroides sp.]